MFIVLEGTDGCGKTTQCKLLCDYFEAQGRAVAYYHFPVLDIDGPFSEVIAEYLRGDVGDLNSLPPYLVGLLFAANRWEQQKQLYADLEMGKILIVDRYMASNLAYSGAKISDLQAREAIIQKLIKLDTTVFHNPIPDTTIFLDVPLTFSMQINKQRQGQQTPDRAYAQGKIDIYEEKSEYQTEVQNVYRTLGKYLEHYQQILCTNSQGEMLSIDAIATKVREVLPHKL